MWWLTLTTAWAADVVWLGPHQASDEAALIATLGEQVSALEPVDLRTAATRETAEDESRIEAVRTVLSDVRQYETRLDGELLIMADLEGPLAAVELIRGKEDLDAMYAALAYQGFAVDRFFAETLAEDDRAAPYRVTVEASTWVRPWADAAGLAPDRELTAYEVAEAPQRIAYGKVREAVSQQLPAAIEVENLPEGATLMIDGAVATPDASGAVKVAPGRHLGHVLLEDRVAGRFGARLGATERTTWTVALDDATWMSWWNAAAAGNPATPPPTLASAIDALGGTVILARPADSGLQAWRITAGGVEALEIASTAPATPKSGKPTPDSDAGLFVAGAVGGGWMSSGDWYLQDPNAVPRTAASVNSATAALGLEVGYQARWLRLAAGVDLPITLGEYALAYTGDSQTRLYTYVHVAAGIPWVQVTGGFLFPYHPAVGGRVNVPLVGGLEARASYTLGIPLTWTRSDGTEWTSEPVYSAWAGLGYRL